MGCMHSSLGPHTHSFSRGFETQSARYFLGSFSKPLSKIEEKPNKNNESILFPLSESTRNSPDDAIRIFPVENEENTPPRQFTVDEVNACTRNFTTKVIGEGGFGKVYAGHTKPINGIRGKKVAVKKLNPNGVQGFNEWLTEVACMRRMNHPNLLSLVGYCCDKNYSFLIYDYMPNSSLDKYVNNERRVILTWSERAKIALGAARGLAYLHDEMQIIFRDFKSSNILLNKDFLPKLSDFGFAKDGPGEGDTHVSTKIVGSHGYTDPEYLKFGHLTKKSDVYAFGVVLLELISGRLAIDLTKPNEEKSLITYAKPFLEGKEDPYLLVDAALDTICKRELKKLLVIARWCLSQGKNRPKMQDIVEELERFPSTI